MNRAKWLEKHYSYMVVGESHEVPCTNCFGTARTSASRSSGDTFCSNQCRGEFEEKSRVARAVREKIDRLINSLSAAERAYLKRRLNHSE